MKKIIIPTICILFVIQTTIFYAHPGRTDSDGGHYDRSTGKYHYHHGYEAHQHINGKCPYDFDDQTGTNSFNYTSGISNSSSYYTRDIPDDSSTTNNNYLGNNKLFTKIATILSSIAFAIGVFLRHYNNPTKQYHYSYPKANAKPLPPLEDINLELLLQEKSNITCYQLLEDLHYDYLSNNEILIFEEDKIRARLDTFSYYTSIIIWIIIFVFTGKLLWNGVSLYLTLSIACFILFFLYLLKFTAWGFIDQKIELKYTTKHTNLVNYYGKFLAPYVTPLFINQVIGAPDETIFQEHLPIFQDNSHIKYVSRKGYCYHNKQNCMGNRLKYKHAFLCNTLSCCPFCGTPINIPDWFEKYQYLIQILNDFNINTDNL